jgi:hypothetical protein
MDLNLFLIRWSEVGWYKMGEFNNLTVHASIFIILLQREPLQIYVEKKVSQIITGVNLYSPHYRGRIEGIGE